MCSFSFFYHCQSIGLQLATGRQDQMTWRQKKMIGTSPRAATVFTGVPDGSTKHLGVLLTAAQTLLVN